MEHYLGMDVHQTSCTFSVRNASGKIVRHDVIATEAQALVDYLDRLGGRLHLCLEESEWSHWLTELLMSHVVEFVVIQPERRRGSKSDRIDAEGLSERIWSGDLGRTVYKDRGRYAALRERARAYTMVTKDVRRTKSRIKSLARGRGADTDGSALYDPSRRGAILETLPPDTRWAVELLGRELELLETLKDEAEAKMVRESRRHPIARILETAPGLGPVRVAQMVPIVGTPHRFRAKRQFWAYCGFGIVTRSSSDWVNHGGRWVRAQVQRTEGLNRNHNPRLKAIFKGAAVTVISRSRSSPLREHYDRLLENGTRPNLATLTIARKIAAIVLAMWKREEPYRPEKS